MKASRWREFFRGRPRGIAGRIALLSLLVTAVAVIIIAIGVLGVAQATFDRLMLKAGQSAATARAMFDHSVVPVFIVAAAIAAAVSLLLAALLAIWLAGPLDEIAPAARRVAPRAYPAPVQRKGPHAGMQPAHPFKPKA